MGFIERETVRVLNEGFDPPVSLPPGRTAVFARWIREPYGAVFFIRRWANGTIDTDLAITARDAEGHWAEPMGYGGGAEWHDPFDRPAGGWDGSSILWGGETGSTVGNDDVFVRVLKGMASPDVASVVLLDPAGQPLDEVDVRQDTGVFIIGLTDDHASRVVARGAHGKVVHERRL